MLSQIKIAFVRSRATLIQDAAGATALVVMLLAGLNLPGVL